MGTLFVSDLDGTLLTREERVSLYSQDRLNRLIDGGVPFTFATARAVKSALGAISGVQCKLPAIFYNGSLIYNPCTGETLHAVLFGEEEKYYVLSILQQFGIEPLIFGADKEERVAWREGRESLGMRRYLSRRTQDKRMLPVHTNEALLSFHVFNFKCIGPQETLQRAWDILKYDTRFICIFHQETYQSDFWMEISPRAATKANGVSKLKSLLGFERVVCFGDSSNDSDMFDVCDEKYAVMNADDWLKAKATGVIGYCEEDGVCKWLEENARFR